MGALDTQQSTPHAQEAPRPATAQANTYEGVVVKLDRGFPLVRYAAEDGAGEVARTAKTGQGGEHERPTQAGEPEGTRQAGEPESPRQAGNPEGAGQAGTPESPGQLIRCQHATALVKGQQVRMVIGDRVEVEVPDTHDKGIIRSIKPRTTVFVRKDPAQRTSKQVLAANFDMVIIAEPITHLNYNRLERELVLAHDTGADVAVMLTKCDLVSAEDAEAATRKVQALAGNDVPVLAISTHWGATMEKARALIAPGITAILIGKSGVGKSSLVNTLAGNALQDTAAVRQGDGKGRHTTVDRVLISIPGGGSVVDMPGIRGLGLWDADQGLELAFADIEALTEHCRFRDCSHSNEPGCAVLSAVDEGRLAQARLNSYRTLATEIQKVRAQREEARHIRGEKASDRRKRRKR